jgi:hypothetical protein
LEQAARLSLLPVVHINTLTTRWAEQALKNKKITIKGLGMPPIKFTASGAPSVASDVLLQVGR